MTGQVTAIKVQKTENVLTTGEAKLKEFTVFYSKDTFLSCILEHSKIA